MVALRYSSCDLWAAQDRWRQREKVGSGEVEDSSRRWESGGRPDAAKSFESSIGQRL